MTMGRQFLRVSNWRGEAGIDHGFGLRRQEGEAPVRRDWMGKRIGEGDENFPLVSLRQVHGDRVHVFEGNDQSIAGIWEQEGDALLTKVPGIALGVFTADCLPIFLYEPAKKVIGIVHAGWRGTAAGVAAKALKKMKEVFQCEGREVKAALGPCIGPCCYEVDGPVKKAFEEAGFPWDLISYPQGEGKWLLNLPRANSIQLERAGISKWNLEALNLCTSCRVNEFYSYRRGDRARGRQLNFIVLKSARIP